jgi:secreted PhoX family phosphatase
MGRMWLAMLWACGGPAGPAGPPGSPGQDGPPGTGQDGQDGEDGQDGQDGGPHALVFEDIGLATTDTEKRAIRASARAWIDGQEHPLQYHTLVRSGEVVGTGIFGLLVDQSGDPLTSQDGSPKISRDADFTSLHVVGSELFAVTHLESSPGGMYLTRLTQDAGTGELVAVDTQSIDFSAEHGLWTPCAGSVSPWGTHLGGEEYPPEARVWEEAASVGQLGVSERDMLFYFGLDAWTDANSDGAPDLPLAAADAVYNPYWYGYPNEVTLTASGATPVKHYSMGRVSVELAKVMSDQRTVYITDDGTNVGLYMYVADTAADLSAGTLYAMKWYQTSAEGAGAADLGWISLGHATDAQIEAYLDADLRFSDLFEVAEPEETCPEGFVGVNTGDQGRECLKLVSGMEVAASRLETRRYAAYLGATTELRKEEGIAHDPLTNTLFIAMSAVERGMEDLAKGEVPDDQYDALGPNDIRLPYNKCGAVYALDLASNSIVGSEYVAENMYAYVEGVPYEGDSPFPGNSCSISGIANPDNLTFIDGYATLIIGEDATVEHQNDVIWAHDLLTGRLDRIFSTPYGAETTSPYWYPDLGGFGYLTAVVQHPFGETDQLQPHDPLDEAAYVGYLGPFPSMSK